MVTICMWVTLEMFGVLCGGDVEGHAFRAGARGAGEGGIAGLRADAHEFWAAELLKRKEC